MMKRILQFLLFLTVCISAHSQALTYNAIATAYVTTTISQNVVFDSNMQAGGNFTFSVLAHNGGGRAGQSDTANVKIQFFNASNVQIGATAQSNNSGNLPNPNAVCGNPCIDTAVPWTTLTISTTLSATDAANVAYAKVTMYGIDGSYWAGDYGPWYRAPTFQQNGGGNLLYNPEFGPYNNVTAQGWTSSPGFGACQGAWGGSNACIVNSDGVPGSSTVGLVANANGGGPSATGGTTSGQPGGYNNTMSVTNAGTGATAGAAPAAPTVTGTTITYSTRTVVSGNTTTNYRTPTTVTTYSDGTTTSAAGAETVYSTVVVGTSTRQVVSGNTTTTYSTPTTTTTITGQSPTVVYGTETVYSTAVTSNVVTTKIVNGVLTTTTTPIITTTIVGGGTSVTANGTATTTTQTVAKGLNYKVYDFDAYTYNCGWLGCIKNWLGPYRVPNLSPGAYNQVASGITNNGVYVPTNGSFPGMGEGTLVAYKGTITAPITTAHPAGSVYRLYFYSNSDDGFVMDINGQTIINDRSTFQLQSVFGNTASGWIDVVAGQTYNFEAWYWNDTGGYGLRLKWDYGAGQMNVPNSAFTTGWITETNIIDTTGMSYSNTGIMDLTGSTVDLYPTYVTIGAGTPGDMIFGTSDGPTLPQQTKIDTWTNKTIEDGNKIYIQQINGDQNTVTMDQKGSKNLIRLQLTGTNNNITANQGVTGIGQNEMRLTFEGNNNVVNLNQARDTQGNPLGTNGHYLDATIAGWGTNLTVQQTNTGGVGGHYNETTISGNGNSVLAKQTDNGNKIMFVKVDGALNTVDVTQKGTGQHYLDAKLTGDRNSATVLQEGSVANKALLDLTNAGGPASVIVNQTGGQSVGVTTTCATAGGCAPITIRQGY